MPEIYDGTVEVKSISREAGSRTKIAVWSKDPNVDAIGACIGPKRARISAIVNELNGEKIDIIPYSEKPEEFIARSLAPSEVLKTVITNADEKTCTVIVPNNQLSLAIGNRGQNAKLAAKLTGYKIDIKPQFDTVTGEEAPEMKKNFAESGMTEENSDEDIIIADEQTPAEETIDLDDSAETSEPVEETTEEKAEEEKTEE